MRKITNYLKAAAIFLFVLLLASNLWGCNEENNGITSSNEPERRFQNLSVGFFSNRNYLDNNLIITEAKFVLRQMNIKASIGENYFDIRMEPFVVHLDVNGRVIIATFGNLPPGFYHRMKFQLHKPSPQENINDPDFTESNRSFSVVVKGHYNGIPFVYKSGITAARGIDIENSPVIITVGGSLHLTIPVNPYLWFSHNGTLDPNDEGNRHYIDNNIRDCFKRIFKDMDMNGEPD